MKRINARLILTLVVLSCVVQSGLQSPSAQATPMRTDSVTPLLAQPAAFEYQGMSNCTLAGCHNDPQKNPKGLPRNAENTPYQIWKLKDKKHSEAYRALFSDPSKIIVKNYRGLKGTDLKQVHAEKDELCLKCHSNGDEKRKHAKGDRSDYATIIQDGVDCESCHGVADKWIGIHREPRWATRTAAERAALGFKPLKDLGVRAEACTRCHVGSGDLTVNHDLLAAGHPRLAFDFAAYLDKLPHHWGKAEDRALYADFDPRVKATGKLLVAKMALDLTEHRAKAEHKQPWPEFGEYDCAACHHRITEPSKRPARPGKTPGSLPYGAGEQLRTVLSLPLPAEELQAFEKDLKAFEELMEKPFPDRAQAAAHARALADRLKRWLDAIKDKRLGAG